jgi:N-acetylglucosaminyl-diphospho-decaprenol L-rhamnosyltransferase
MSTVAPAPTMLTDVGGTPRLVVIVVNFRTPDLTLDCLRALEPQIADLPGARVLVVENGSGDDSAARLQAALDATPGWAAWVELLVCARNWGFAGGNNRGIERYPAARYYLLLNSDTLVHPGCLRYCWDLLERTPQIGALSCCLLNRDGSVQNVTRRFPTPLRLIARTLGLPWSWPRRFAWADTEDLGWDRRREARDVDWIGGAFLWTRGDLVRRIGPLDEEFFFEGEDIEFCQRVWRAGYRVYYDPAVTITHFGGSSSDPTRMAARLRNVHRWRARYIYLRKCHGALAAALVRGVDLAWSWLQVARLTLTGRGQEPRCQDARAVAHLLSRKLEPA